MANRESVKSQRAHVNIKNIRPSFIEKIPIYEITRKK